MIVLSLSLIPSYSCSMWGPGLQGPSMGTDLGFSLYNLTTSGLRGGYRLHTNQKRICHLHEDNDSSG